MASIAAQIAVAVVTELNGNSFSQEFTASRTWSPDLDRKDLDALTVTVVPRRRENFERAARTSHRSEYTIDVGLQKAVDPADNDAVDALVLLAEEVADYMADRALAAYAAAKIFRVAQDPLADFEDLRTNRQFTGIVSLTYLVVA